MAAVGLVLLKLTRHLLQLQLTTSSQMPPVSTRPTARTLVGTVSPSAV